MVLNSILQGPDSNFGIEFRDLQSGVRRMTLAGNACERPSCDNSREPAPDTTDMHPGHPHGSRGGAARKSTLAALESRKATLSSQKSDLRKVYDKIQQCLEVAGDVDDCLAERLGEHKP